MTAQIEVGDVVAYRAKFLRNIGDYSHARASMRGTVTEVTEWLAMVKWDQGEPRGVHVGNLVRADSLHLEPS